jgi:hypothetical protein
MHGKRKRKINYKRASCLFFEGQDERATDATTIRFVYLVCKSLEVEDENEKKIVHYLYLRLCISCTIADQSAGHLEPLHGNVSDSSSDSGAGCVRSI